MLKILIIKYKKVEPKILLWIFKLNEDSICLKYHKPKKYSDFITLNEDLEGNMLGDQWNTWKSVNQ